MRNFSPGLQQFVQYRNQWVDTWTVVDTSSFDIREDAFRVNLKKLSHPFTDYIVQVKMISGTANKSRSDLWSDVAEVRAKTKPALPSGPPKVNLGSFQVQDTGSKRTVFAYWKLMDPQEFNGPNFRYVSRAGAMTPALINGSYARFDDVPVSETNIKVTAANSEGRATTWSSLVVPQAEFLVGLQPRSLTKIWKGAGNFEIAWRRPERDVTSYTLFWCRAESGEDRPYQCDGYLDWKSLYPQGWKLMSCSHCQELCQ